MSNEKNERVHGILVDAAFTDKNFPSTLNVFAKRRAGSWELFGIEIPADDLPRIVELVQRTMRADAPFYTHFYDDQTLTVVFKTCIFRVSPDRSTWEPILEYGRARDIPEEQLDFWPNRFQDEQHYFEPTDYL